MHKIPVQSTISATYDFAFRHFLAVLGIAWFPYVLLAAVAAATLFGLAPDLLGRIMRGDFDMSLFASAVRVVGLVWLASIIVRSMVTVGVLERALGRAHGPAYFYFSLGAPVWRLIGAIILVFLVLVLLAIVTFGVMGGLCYALVHFVPNFGKALAVVVGVVAALWFIYAIVRLTFFLPAVVVAEGHFGIVRSWELGAGNFWRIVLVLIVAFVPVAMGLQIVQSAITGPFTFMPADFGSQFGPHITPDAAGKAYVSLLASLFKQMQSVWPALLILYAIQTVLYLGLGNGLVANAYLGVTTPKNGAGSTEAAA